MKSNQIYNRDLKKQQLICLWEKNIWRALFSLNRVSSAKNKDLWSYYLYCSPSLGAMKIFWLRLESVYVLHLYIQSMSHTKISGIYSQAAFTANQWAVSAEQQGGLHKVTLTVLRGAGEHYSHTLCSHSPCWLKHLNWVLTIIQANVHSLSQLDLERLATQTLTQFHKVSGELTSSCDFWIKKINKKNVLWIDFCYVSQSELTNQPN